MGSNRGCDEGEEMRVEDAVWEPWRKPSRGSKPSESTLALRALQVGDVKRIVHDDVACNPRREGRDGHCSLSDSICRLRKQGWEIEYYHEAPHIMVVRRTK